MSNTPNPAKSRLWLDGDGFRAPAGTALPADIYAPTLTGWEPFGGIQAGFTVERAQEKEKLSIWNKIGTYRTRTGDEEGTIKFRPVDESKATVLTLLTGGSIVAAAGGYEWIKGTSETFALIIRVQDGLEWAAYFLKKTELANIPTEVLNDEQLNGWDFEITPLIPDDGSVSIRKFTKNNPLA